MQDQSCQKTLQCGVGKCDGFGQTASSNPLDVAFPSPKSIPMRLHPTKNSSEDIRAHSAFEVCILVVLPSHIEILVHEEVQAELALPVDDFDLEQTSVLDTSNS